MFGVELFHKANYIIDLVGGQMVEIVAAYLRMCAN